MRAVGAYLRTLPLDVLLWGFWGISGACHFMFGLVLLMIGVPGTVVALICLSILLYLRATAFGEALKCKNRMGSPCPKYLDRGPFIKNLVMAWEFVVFISLYSFVMPFDRLVMPRLEPQVERGVPKNKQVGKALYPVLLVHGFLCNSIFMLPIRMFLGYHGVTSIYTMALSPCLGDISKYTEDLSKKVSMILKHTGAQKVIIVGHSLGGIVARSYIHNCNKGDTVAKIITLGSPHHGTVLTQSKRAKHLECPVICQLGYESQFLQILNCMEDSCCVPITSIFTYDDEVVVPQESSILDTKLSRNIPCSGMGHLSMPVSLTINKLILKEVLCLKSAK